MSIKRLMYRTIMSLLFIGAVYITISSITNITIFNMKESLAAEVTNFEMEMTEDVQERKLYLPEKNLNRLIERKEYISSDEIDGPETLEEAIDFNQYPTATVVATGYTAGRESTGKSPGHPEYGITYSGVKVKRDLYSTIAADLTVFPIGTILYIPDYGYGVVADIGGAIKGNKIDLYFDTVDEVYSEWGKRELEVYVVEQGNGQVSEADLQTLNENETLQVYRN